MKIAILSSFPLADKQSQKVSFLKSIVDNNLIDDIIVVYSHKSIKDHFNEFQKRKKNISIFNKSTNVNLQEIANNISLKDFARGKGIPVYLFNRFSDEECVKLLKGYKPYVAHNFSGEFVPKSILNIPTTGILSAHYGKLPEIRGGDTIRWSIYLNMPIFVTHFFLVPELDMGDIVLLNKVKVDKCDTIYDIRKKCQNLSWIGHSKFYDLISNNTFSVQKQTSEMGTTYYSMGKLMASKVDEILTNKSYSHYEE